MKSINRNPPIQKNPEIQYLNLKTQVCLATDCTKQKRELLNWKTDHKKSPKMQCREKKKCRKYKRQVETKEDRQGPRLI